MIELTTYSASRVDHSKCFGCTRCIKICPTEAIRIRNGKAVINDRRCIDCGNCQMVCPADAFYTEQNDLHRIGDYKYRVLLFPSVLYLEFL